MFLDSSYFTGELSLPMLSAKMGAQQGVAKLINQVSGENSLQWFIDRYEEEFLRELLGDRLSEAFKEGIAVEAPLQIWADLKSRIYERRGDHNFSPAANYVYFFAMTAAASKTSMIGEVKPQGDRMNNVSPDDKMVKAWNDMSAAAHRIRQWVFVHRKEIIAVLPEWGECWRGWYCDHVFTRINKWGI